MACSDFTLDDIKTQFQLSIAEDKRLFSDVKPFDVPTSLLQVLESNVPLALAIDTEKARSEFIIAPILAEYKRIFTHRVSLFSGVDFSIDAQRGLNGTCDFILSRSPEQFYITAPIILPASPPLWSLVQLPPRQTGAAFAVRSTRRVVRCPTLNRVLTARERCTAHRARDRART